MEWATQWVQLGHALTRLCFCVLLQEAALAALAAEQGDNMALVEHDEDVIF